MNDDFLKKHRIRPNSDLVDSISERLETNDLRRTDMFANKLRPTILTFVALIGVFALTFAFSPAVRAAVQSLFTFNGVEVSVDEESGELIVSGNTDAILYQDENSVMIAGEDGTEMAGMSIVNVVETPINVDDIPSQFPEFVMPTNLPAGYELQPEAITFDGMVSVTWENAEGDWISYMWGEMMMPDMPSMELPEGAELVDVLGGDVDMDEAVMIDITDEDIDLSELPAEFAEEISSLMQPYQIVPSPEGDIALLMSESNGVSVQVSASDTSLTEAELQSIIP